MKLLIVVLALVLVLSLFVVRSKETYVLPDPTPGSDICPPGFVLTCVSKNLAGVTETVPFPASLPKPCEDTHTPLCLPGPEHTKPAYAVKKIVA